jgi:hypothetical protein
VAFRRGHDSNQEKAALSLAVEQPPAGPAGEVGKLE